MDHVGAQACCVARDWSGLSCIVLLYPRPTALCMYYCRCDNISSRLSGVAYRTSKDLVTWSEPVMALVLPTSISPPTFNRCALEQKNVLLGESVRDEHCWGHVTCHMPHAAHTNRNSCKHHSSFISGASESPFVFARGGTYYLSICAASLEYNRTLLFASALVVGAGMQ